MEDDDESRARKERIRQQNIDSRFSLPYYVRLPFTTSLAFLIGMGLGVTHGSQTAGLRFRAENAHRLPTTATGWYFYHKSKNYQRAYGGVIEGLKMGGKVSIWTTGFFGVEAMLDRYRGSKDFLNTVLASLSVAGTFGAWHRLPFTTTVRMARTGLVVGLAYGLTQDALGYVRGRVPGYVKFLGRVRGRENNDTNGDDAGIP